MCGITAMLLYPQERSPEDWQDIRSAFTQNLLFNEERGPAATGIAIADRYGSIDVRKRMVPAAVFASQLDYQQLLLSLGPDTTLLLGHTRLPTKGDPRNTKNNHPLQAGSVLGIHNGHIENDDELFARYGFLRDGEVDSEIIFRLLESISTPEFENNYLEHAQSLIRLLKGRFTFLAYDQRRPTELLVVKHDEPLCLHYHAEWNALVFSSRYVFLRKIFGRLSVVDTLEDNQLSVFDVRTISEFGALPSKTIPLFAKDEIYVG